MPNGQGVVRNWISSVDDPSLAVPRAVACLGSTLNITPYSILVSCCNRISSPPNPMETRRRVVCRGLSNGVRLARTLC